MSFSRLKTICRGEIIEHAPLAPYTSWRTGGPADYLFRPADIADLQTILQILPSEIPVTWIGLGSNTLIRDGGLAGVVIITQGIFCQLIQHPEHYLRAEAGLSCAQLARQSARLGLSGLEFMAGIPGTVGGALAMNAGCFGGETWTLVQQVEVINRQGVRKIQPATAFKIGYRSVERATNEWFLAGYFAVKMGDKNTSLSQIRNLLEKRNQTQPTGSANCGSVFRNPEHDYAGRLIESCGLKEKRIGGAVVSAKHANFIINEGQATAADIEHLIHEVQAIVLQKTGVRLLPEVCIMGRSL